MAVYWTVLTGLHSVLDRRGSVTVSTVTMTVMGQRTCRELVTKVRSGGYKTIFNFSSAENEISTAHKC